MNEQLLPLAMLDIAEDGRLEGITRFQKLVFLAQREREGASPYDFRADDYGPFSPDLYDDIDRLVDGDLIDYDEEETEFGNKVQVYTLTDMGRRAVENSDEMDFPVPEGELEELGDDFEDVDLWDLLEYVYTEYPRMARNSELSLV
ncbi:PadR family transcriptional regulator [Halobaculum sp. MBLA0143]|uniref:PadR family transcriptional regulator n=1 Tax=Halobaculum sp. MBLA0143 TaxID=3079933 RepID=UPI0035261F7B